MKCAASPTINVNNLYTIAQYTWCAWDNTRIEYATQTSIRDMIYDFSDQISTLQKNRLDKTVATNPRDIWEYLVLCV